MKTFCFDVDGTICTQTKSDYENAQPIQPMIDKINKLYYEGNIIVIHTARGQSSGVDWEAFTVRQLRGWKVKFHSFYYGKPSADYYIDDKAVSISDFLEGKY